MKNEKSIFLNESENTKSFARHARACAGLAAALLLCCSVAVGCDRAPSAEDGLGTEAVTQEVTSSEPTREETMEETTIAPEEAAFPCSQ